MAVPITGGLHNISNMIYDVFGAMDQISDAKNGSLIHYSKKTLVSSSAYIEENIVVEDIAVPLMKFLNNTYIAYVLTALQLSNVTSKYRVVRDAISRVSTESFDTLEDLVDGNLGVATEAGDINPVDIEKAVEALAIARVIEFNFDVGEGEVIEEDGVNGLMNNESDPKKAREQMRGKKNAMRDARGRNAGATVSVPITVSILPHAISESVAEGFMALNFTPAFSRRWKMYRAGELSLFKDLFLSRDLVDKYAKAMKEDNHNVLQSMVDGKNARRSKQIKGVMREISQRGVASNNVASSILVFDKRTFDSACDSANLSFSNVKQRQSFFDDAMAMMVAVVDTSFDSVDLYFNSLKAHSTLSFRMLEKSAKDKQGVDIKDVMSAISKGNAPRF